MRRVGRYIGEAVLAACALCMLLLLSPALLLCELVCDLDDPAESYRRYW